MKIPTLLKVCIASVVLAILPARGAQLTNFFSTSLPSGSYDFLGAYWSTASETNATLAAFDEPGSITIGQNPGDFNGENLVIAWDISGTTKIITSAGTNITIGATNVVVTFNGTQNNYIDAACTITVASGSTLIEADSHDQGLNFDSQSVTLAGGGTIIFATSVGGNSSAVLTQNMPGGKVILEQTNNSGTDYLLSGGYALDAGALVFGTATGAGGAFSNFASGKLFKISGGSIDNTSGSAQTLGLGVGGVSLAGNFTFTGSGSLSFNTNLVALTANVVVTNLSNTLSMSAISGSGFGLTATGPGTLSIGGASTYSGSTVVQSGTLALTGSSPTNLTQTSSIQFLTNSVFDLSGLTAGGIDNPNTLALTNTTLVLTIPLNPITNMVVGSLALGGSNTIIRIAALPVVTRYPTVFPLINYSNTLAVTNFSLAALPPSFTIPYGGYLSTSNAGLVDLVLTNGPVPARALTWIGTDPSNPTSWDVQTSFNWLTNAIDPPTTFNQADLVTFNDSSAAKSTSPGQVVLTTTLTPSTMTVSNNALNYTFTGGGNLADPLSGPLQVVKQGTGTLVMDNTSPNTYSGGTLISEGTLQLGNNNDGQGSLGVGPVVDNGSLSLQSGYNTMANPISGSGSILQYGEGTVTLSGTISGAIAISQYGQGTLVLAGASATYTGAITVFSNTTLQLGSSTALGAASGITVQSGGILDLNAQSAGAVPVFAQGAGSVPNGGSQGAIDNSSTTASPGDLGVEFLTLTGNTTLSSSGGRWDIRSPGGDTGAVGSSPSTSSAYLSTGGQPYNLTVLGAQFLGIVSAWVDPALADIDVVSGTLDYEGNTSGLGNPADTLTLEQGAILQLANAANPLDKSIVIHGNGEVLNSSGVNSMTGPIDLADEGFETIFDVAAGTLNLEGAVSGPSPLEVTDVGTLILNGGNTFSGGIAQGAGTVILNGDNSLLTNATIVSGGTFVLDGIVGGATTNENTGLLSGTGTNLGPVDISAEFDPGSSNSAGTFTVGAPGTPGAPSSLTLESSGNTSFILGGTNTVGGGVNGLVVVNGKLTLNAYTTITINPIDILSGGRYVLFTYTGALSIPGGLASISVPPTFSGYNFTLNTSTPGQISVTATGGPTTVWNGGAGAADTTWENPANWGGTSIAAGDNLYFNGNTSLNNTNNFATDTPFGNITFADGAGPFVLNGNNVEMGNGIFINDSADPQTVNMGVDFGASFAFQGGNSPSAPLLIAGGLNDSGNATSVYLNGYGTLINNMSVTGGAGAGTNALTLTNNAANWTILNNAASTPMTLPWGIEVMAGTLTYGSATSAPVFDGTPANADVNGDDTFIGDIAGTTATFNMVNGTLTLAARVDVGEVYGSTGILNQSGGTLNLSELQTANEVGTAFVNISGGTMNVAGSEVYNATRTNATITLTGGNLICSTLDISRCINSGIPGVVNLNGGQITTGRVTTASSAATATSTGDTATFYFNGGTLVASGSSTTFYQGNVASPACPITSMVRSNGAIINDGGFAITFLEPLQHDASLAGALDGGLTKLGAGTNTLGKANTYTGPTVINAGTLTLSSPGNIIDSVSINIAAGATLNPSGTLTLPSGQTLEGGGNIAGSLTAGAGSIVSPGSSNATGTLAVSGAVSLGGATYMKLNATTNDELSSSSSMTYGGSLVVSNIGPTLAAGDVFTLFHGTSYAGSFTSITLPALGGYLAWQTNLSVNGTISVVSTIPASPTISSVSLSSGNLVFSGSSGAANRVYYVLSTTNLALPLADWTVVSTNTFSASGAFSVTNPITAGPAMFYSLEIQIPAP